MLHVAFLLLSALASQTVPTLAGELKELPSKGKDGPLITCEGTVNLPNGALLRAYLYYGRIYTGKELFTDFATVNNGKFTQDFPVFPRKILPGKYIARFSFEPDLQTQAIAGFAFTKIDLTLQVGTAEDFEREAKLVREQLVGEIRGLTAIADQITAKLQELKGKPPAAWNELMEDWRTRTLEIQKRSDPRRVPEYSILNLDLIADSGMENLCGILLSAARFAAQGQGDVAVEGLTRLRQTAEYSASEIASPRLSDPGQIVLLIDQARALLREALGHPDAPVLPARRKFVEMNSLLDKSLPEDFHPLILEIGTRGVAFFNALADKEAGAKELQAELDRSLEKLATPLRRIK